MAGRKRCQPAVSIKIGNVKPLLDNWVDNSTYKCRTCRFFVSKNEKIGRCRRRCPVVEVGYPAVYPTDWCGEHKIDENKI